MADAQAEPKPLLPALKPFYDVAVPLSWLVVRAGVGWNLLVHGYGKITVGPTPGFLKAFVDLGFAPPAPYFWTTLVVETLAGIGLILGLFTRFFAVAAAIELLVITITYWHTGFSWLRQGYEYTLLWGLMCAAIALRGGGPYSVDRRAMSGHDVRFWSKADIYCCSAHVRFQGQSRHDGLPRSLS